MALLARFPVPVVALEIVPTLEPYVEDSTDPAIRDVCRIAANFAMELAAAPSVARAMQLWERLRVIRALIDHVELQAGARADELSGADPRRI